MTVTCNSAAALCVLVMAGYVAVPSGVAAQGIRTPTDSVANRSVPAGQEYCEFLGGAWVPNNRGYRDFKPNGRVYTAQKESFAHQAAWDACIKGEPIGNDGCINGGCKRGPMLPIGRSTPTTPVRPSGLPTGDFEYYWRQVNGNWASKPVRTATQGCPHPGNQACDARFQKTYLAGEGTTYHVNGCGAAPIQIACAVQKAGYQQPARPPGAQQPAQPQMNTFCQIYADKSVADNTAGQQRHCPAFAKTSVNWKGHYDWCTRQTSSTPVNKVRDERAALLKSCLSGPVASAAPKPTGRYQPGERIIGRVGEWDVREHIRKDGSFERCTITMEKYKPVVWRVMSMDDNRYLLSVPQPPDLANNTRRPIRYGVNRKYFDGVAHVIGGRTVLNISSTINEFSVMSDVDIPMGRSTYRVFFYSMPAAMNALKACRARFR